MVKALALTRAEAVLMVYAEATQDGGDGLQAIRNTFTIRLMAAAAAVGLQTAAMVLMAKYRPIGVQVTARSCPADGMATIPILPLIETV